MEEYLLVQERNQREITKYQTQYQSTQLEIQRYREQAEAANRKCKETETEIYNLRSSISDYEGKLRSKESMFDDHNYLQSQLNQ
jgi:peptidoglycan hydrolase CwlO-like protein